MSVVRFTARAGALALVTAALALGPTTGARAATTAAAAGSHPHHTSKSAIAAADDTPGELQGTVTMSDGSGPNGDVTLYEWNSSDTAFEYADDLVVSPDQTGFDFGDLTPGTYYLAFVPDDQQRYAEAFSGGASQPADSPDDAAAIDLSAGGDQSVDLTSGLAPDAQTISGTVVGPDGQPVAGVTIQADAQDGTDPTVWYDDQYDSYTADGHYAITLPPGTWRLDAVPDDDIDDNGATTATFTTPGATVADPIVLTAAGHQTVTGTVVDSAGHPVADANVSLQELSGSPGAWTGSSEVDETSTDATGTYTFDGVRTGRSYVVQVSKGGYRETVGGSPDDDPLDAPGFAVDGDTTVDPVVLTQASSVSGTVSGPDGPLADTEVDLYRWSADDGSWVMIDSTTSDDQGSYALTTLDPDTTYTLEVWPNDDTLEPTWLGGSATEPASPAPGNSFSTTDTATAFTENITATTAPVIGGTVTNQAGDPIGGATVTGYVWDGTTWDQGNTVTAGDDGTFRLPEPLGATVTVRFSRGGYQAVYYGGSTSLPTAPSSGNSLTVAATGSTVGTVALAPFQSSLGKVAGQKLDYCLTNTLPANDDGSSQAVPVPFALKFFGTPYSQLWVNNNGNITFNDSLSEYTPDDITGDTGVPIIAPFFADVDTRGAGSNLVTYGASPDGKSFCVNWADVGYFNAHDDKLNTFQLILTKDDTGAGRSAGDFDITFNYDQISWETGDASNGANGFGGTSALAGFSAGTGTAGTYVELPGSLVNGALLDNGPDALIAGHQGSTTTGRYVFPVLNAGLTSQLGNLTGTVVTQDQQGVAGAYVDACPTDGGGCSYTTTASDGSYDFSALLAATYSITVWPPDDSLFSGGGTATVTGGATTTVDPIVLTAPTPMPPNVTMSNNGISGGVPSVYFEDPTTFSMTGCAGVTSPTYTVTLADGTRAAHGALIESPTGTYHADIPPYYPSHGDAVFTTNVPATCGGTPTSFNLYIDPSGVVADQYGRPISGATVTLSRSDTADGDFTPVADGSDVMSASNRHNPDTTDAHGQFAWMVQDGWYEVSASAPGCASGSTPAMQVPPAQIDLAIELTCSAAAPSPTSRPSITGTPQVGQTLHVTPAAWAAPIATTGTTLMRQVGNGPASAVALHGGTYTLTAHDAGATFYATSTGRAPDVVPAELPSAAVHFQAVTATSDRVTVAAASAGHPTAHTPVAASVKLTVKPKRPSHHKKAKVVVTVTAATAPGGTVRLHDGKKAIGKAVILKNGRAVLKVRLKKGKHRLTAVYSGSPTVAAATSPTVKVRVR